MPYRAIPVCVAIPAENRLWNSRGGGVVVTVVVGEVVVVVVSVVVELPATLVDGIEPVVDSTN